MEEADNTDKKPSLESSPICKIHDHAASEVEVLESFSQAITRVVEAVAPAVIGITSRTMLRDSGRSIEREGSGSGAVVGINTAIIAAAQGIGFAIPSNTASWVLSKLMTQGRVTRSYLGIAGAPRPLSRRTVRILNLPTEHAVVILQVAPGGPADRAGLQIGDLVIRIGDRDVATMDDIYRFLTAWPAGKPVKVTVLRLGERLEIDVRPAEAAASG